MRKGQKMRPGNLAKMIAGARAKRPPAEVRFFAKVRKTDTCWIWTGSVWHGYGNFLFQGKVRQAHRVSWVMAGRELPEKPLVLDHMCRNQVCVNPDHLRVVTPRVNATENNVSPLALNAQKTHCVHGHPFSPENTRYYTPRFMVDCRGRKKPGRPVRVCIACYEARGSKRQAGHSQFRDERKP